MKRIIAIISLIALFLLNCGSAMADDLPDSHKLLYQGHGSLRIVTSEGKVIYVDPYAGEGYDLPADLILITHGHRDHTAVDLIKKLEDISNKCDVSLTLSFTGKKEDLPSELQEKVLDFA